MRKFLFHLATLTLLLFAIHVGLFVAQLGVKTETSRWIHEAFLKKEEAAKNIDGERLLIISGSNALFSLSAESISEELDLPAVNLGIQAGLKIEYIFERYLDLVREGDLILLPLEYESYSYDGNTSETLSDFTSSRDPTWLLSKFNRLSNTAFSFGVGELISRNLKRVRPDTELIGFYDATHITSFGDRNYISPSSRTEGDLDHLRSYEAVELKFTDGSKKILREFFAECHKRKATVVLTFPVTIDFNNYEKETFQNGIREIREFADENGVSVLGEPIDFLLPVDLFHNTNYHTSSEGRSVSTARLIKLLDDYLEENGPLASGK